MKFVIRPHEKNWLELVCMFDKLMDSLQKLFCWNQVILLMHFFHVEFSSYPPTTHVDLLTSTPMAEMTCNSELI